jgi:hypothetical protein
MLLIAIPYAGTTRVAVGSIYDHVIVQVSKILHLSIWHVAYEDFQAKTKMKTWCFNFILFFQRFSHITGKFI